MSNSSGLPRRRSIQELASILTTDRLVWILGGGIVLIGLALRLSIAWQGLETLALKVVADDGFYYLLTADRISNGQNISFDGVTLSNGYHPLWLFFVTPLYLIPGRELPLHLALTASSLLDVAAAGLVALAAGKLTGNRAAALFALTFYLFIPQNVFSSANGVESSLAAMLVGALLLILVSVWRQRQEDWVRWSVVTGIVGGLMVLARLESALVLAAVLALIAMFQPGGQRWRAPSIAGATAAVIVAPWFLWSFFALGTVMPVSAESIAWLLRELYSAHHPDADLSDEVRHGLSYTKFILLTRLPDLYFPAKPFAVLFLAGLVLLGGHFLLLSRGLLRLRATRHILIAALPLSAFTVMLLFNSSYRWFVREWYFAWGVPMVALFVGVAFAYLDEVLASVPIFSGQQVRAAAAGTRQLLLYCVLVGLLVLAYVGPARDTWRRGLYPEQYERLQAALYVKEEIDPSARVAAFNSGLMGYFSDRTVVNLDGVVNPEAFRALREHRLVDYLRTVDVTYVADRDGAWTILRAYIRPDDWSQSLWGEDPNRAFVPIATFGPDTMFGQMRIWRLVE